MGAAEERLNPLKVRIVIIGSTGSGKSALAARLAAKLQISHTELDNLHWLPEWQDRTDAEFREPVDVATKQSPWFIDGGYGGEQFGAIREGCPAATATTSRSSVRLATIRSCFGR